MVNAGDRGEGADIRITRVERINEKTIMVNVAAYDVSDGSFSRNERMILMKVNSGGYTVTTSTGWKLTTEKF